MKTQYKVIAFSIALGVLAWISDSIVDHFFFGHEGSFWNALIYDLPAREIYMRSLAFILFVACGIIISRVLVRRQRAEVALRESREWISTTLKSIGDAVIRTDTKGFVT